MGLFEHWPYVDFHDLNLDWIIKEIPKVYASRDEAQASAEASAESAAASQLSADAALASQEAAHQSELNAAQSEENAAESEANAKNYSDHIADPVSGIVAEWLEDNITPTTPAVDASLTVSGAAADAKVTGDKITELNYGVIKPIVTEQDGSYIDTTGEERESSNYKTVKIVVYGLTEIKITPKVTSNYMNYVFTDSNTVKIGTEYGAFSDAGENTIQVPDGAYYIRCSCNKSVGDIEYNADWNKLVLLKYENIPLDEKVSKINTDTYFIENKSISYSQMDQNKTGMLDIYGSAKTFANMLISDYLVCHPGTDISYDLAYIFGPNYVAFVFYDNRKAIVSSIAAPSGTSGTYVRFTGTSTVPEGAYFVRFAMAKNNAAGMQASDQFVNLVTDVPVKDYIDTESNGNQWKGKKWCAYGTSITDTSYIDPNTGQPTGKFVPFLVEYSGLQVTNRGRAGGTLGSNGIHGGTSTILNAILNSTDLDTYDLITLEGFVNDFAAAVSIGDVGDTTNDTLCGALHLAISYILENSHATLVLITETTGKEYAIPGGTTVNYNILRKNSLQKYQEEYNEAIIKMGAYYGVPVIKAGEESQINQYHPEFIIDQIHHTVLGGEQYATTIWNKLKNIMPMKTN